MVVHIEGCQPQDPQTLGSAGRKSSGNNSVDPLLPYFPLCCERKKAQLKF